jgi:hypothetical protein
MAGGGDDMRMTQFRAPSKRVRDELERVFRFVGEVNPYGGQTITIEDCFLVICEKYGPAIAAQCAIEIQLH